MKRFTTSELEDAVAPVRAVGAAVPPANKASGEFLAAPRSTAQSIVSTLCNLGVEAFFGVPGGPIIAIFDAEAARAGRAPRRA